MWIVRLALRRPYTFVVAALVLLLLTPFVLLRTPTDIFPEINIPVISVVWVYNGLNAKEVEERIIYNHERMISTLVNDIEHIESTAYNSAASTLVMWFYRNIEGGHPVNTGKTSSWLHPFARRQSVFERGFERFREGYRNLLGAVLSHRILFAILFLAFCSGTGALIPQLGQNFFPRSCRFSRTDS